MYRFSACLAPKSHVVGYNVLVLRKNSTLSEVGLATVRMLIYGGMVSLGLTKYQIKKISTRLIGYKFCCQC